MTKLKLIVAAAILSAPLATYSIAARAATASNLQSGADTSNVHDTKRSAAMKQMHMREHRRHAM